MKKFFVIVVALFAFNAIYAQNEKVDNSTVLMMLENGFSAQEIIGYIENASDRSIKMGMQNMVELKKAGADPELITYLQSIAKTDFGYEGVYWANVQSGDPVKLLPTYFEKEKKGFSGGAAALIGGASSVLLGGVSSRGGAVATVAGATVLATTAAEVNKLVLPGGHAKIVLTGAEASNPVFRFYFPKTQNNSFDNGSDNLWFQNFLSAIQSPNEFKCIHLKTNKKGTKRSFADGLKFTSTGFYSSSTSTKNMEDFSIKTINNNTFEVSFPNGLEPGEYCFIYNNGSNETFLKKVFCFDFSIQ